MVNWVSYKGKEIKGQSSLPKPRKENTRPGKTPAGLTKNEP